MKTKTTTNRRSSSRFCHWLAVLPALMALGYSNVTPAEATHAEELIGAGNAFLEQAVDDYLERSNITARHQIQINQLDPRLRLPLCGTPLMTTLESPAQPVGRVTLRIRCESNAPWTVFIPGQVRLFREVVVASRPLKRDGLITEMDVGLAERDVGLLNQGYLTEKHQVVGKKLTRAAIIDQVITPTQLQLAEAVRKGDHVVISAKSGIISVRMPGEALSSGSVGKQISVRNIKSNRVVRARVTAPGQVEVPM
ncbi:flagella basal body P-ring formation protein FlgA [Pseudomonas sp. HMWF032]|uniref:flagellar basal body P-ring formation chaperone FlgA n=1 Tax=unclassified Pseudomonas TaxID=196821 RepID=UPI000D341EF9|nr:MULTISPECIES: flagellar basal body P-ring formation chaperone FlgA [unclassified Pseudomonas]PTS83753.1 flagella basal body P-ring formation protein FlgA [Pseudomonas sp. HMWF032]PTT83627.1 flagella basal body P-ring formation protein FlgA [Pseudomonas sp. HMWF010]WAC44990.1 flagellar basal body P-ring formation chaperone FlgA [Pseudomonas sp. SL4(2022)]